MNTKTFLGSRIQEIRKQKGLKQSEFAEILNIDPKYISKIECGRCFPSFELLDKISIALNKPIGDFFNIEHLQSREILQEKTINKIKSLPDEKLRSLYKIITEIF